MGFLVLESFAFHIFVGPFPNDFLSRKTRWKATWRNRDEVIIVESLYQQRAQNLTNTTCRFIPSIAVDCSASLTPEMSKPAIIPEYDDEEEQCCMLLHATADARLPHNTTVNHIPNVVGSSVLLAVMRERDGRCADCGIQTHCLQANRNTNESQKIPLTIRNEVYRGRCLLCHPLPYGLREFKRWHGCQSTPHGSQHASIDETDDSFEIRRILHSMKQFPLDECNQSAGCEAIWVHSWDDEASTIIGRAGGIDLIFHAMINFPANARMQLCAFGALENLACDRRNASLIINAGGTLFIIQAIIRHKNENTLAVYAMRALDALTFQGANGL